MAANTTTAAPATGTVVEARPWANGAEAAHTRRGIVGAAWGTDGEYVLVWFPSLDGGVMVPGFSVQPILVSKLTEARELDALPASWVAKVYRAARRANQARQLPIGLRGAAFKLEAAHRANLRTR
jgi:hypothetical protein